MYYRHSLNYIYPEKSDEHMITVKHKHDTHFDENYDYIDKRFSRKIKNAFFWLAMNLIVFPLLHITHGLRIHGKKNLKEQRELLKGGAITISNHVFKWDYLCVLKAIRPRLERFPAWKTNFEGSERGIIRWAGGMPIPTDNIRAMRAFKDAMDEVLSTKKWVHFFPEGSMWYYYPDIRPLKTAVFKMAVKHQRPIIPMAFSFRERKGITRLFTKKPCVDLHIGKVLIPNKETPTYLEVERLHKTSYDMMQRMAGITPDMENYRTDQKIENYQKTM
ncbi:MAG: 1-acyl-sn-glycerol-3-phosphate acyltransferase [Clostridia bacterium]|nr:1-acyl-sn-glycerol-3-phosphate acyltransferase [Clostridia bacterium]